MRFSERSIYNCRWAVSGKKVDDTVEGLVGIVGMQGRQAQVAGFCVRDGVLHGFRIPYLANQDHVRGFAHGILEGVSIRQGVQTNFTLVDHGFLVFIDVLDGIFDGQDMPGFAGVSVVDHGSQGGRFARTGRTDHQDQPPRLHDQVFQDWREIELFHRGDYALDIANYHSGVAALAKYIYAKTAQALD